MTEPLASPQAPPPCNNGGATYNDNPPPVQIHWARLVLPDTAPTWSTLRQLFPDLHRNQPGPVLWGWYDRTARILGRRALVGWCSAPSRRAVEGVVVELPGQACAHLGTDLPRVLTTLLKLGHATRADFALDDPTGALDRTRILEAERSHNIVTRYRGTRLPDGTRAALRQVTHILHGNIRTWSLYFGSPTSASQVRIYDKAAETGNAGHLVRLEFVARKSLAHRLLRAALERGGAPVRAEINARLRFTSPPPGQDTNRRRWPAAAWWRTIIGTPTATDRLAPAHPGPPRTLDDLRAYFRNTAAPTASAILAADHGDLSWLEATIAAAWPRVRPEHRALIALVADTASLVADTIQPQPHD